MGAAAGRAEREAAAGALCRAARPLAAGDLNFLLVTRAAHGINRLIDVSQHGVVEGGEFRRTRSFWRGKR